MNARRPTIAFLTSCGIGGALGAGALGVLLWPEVAPAPRARAKLADLALPRGAQESNPKIARELARVAELETRRDVTARQGPP